MLEFRICRVGVLWFRVNKGFAASLLSKTLFVPPTLFGKQGYRVIPSRRDSP